MSMNNIVARGIVALVQAAGRIQRVQARLLSGEIKDDVEHIEPYGFTSHAKPGAEHVTLFLDGDRSHAVAIVVSDRRYRLQDLPDGAVALYDSSGTHVVLDGQGGVEVTAATRVRIACPLVEVEGELRVNGNIVATGHIADQGGAKTMADMRSAHNAHRGHNLPGSTPDVSA
jgi:phage baseplate assembly protein V